MSRRLVVAVVTAAAMGVIAPTRSWSSDVRRPVSGVDMQTPDSGLRTPDAQNQPAPPAGRVPVPNSRITFKDAVDQAIQHNPSVQQAATEILRAEGLLHQARSAVLPGIAANVVTLTQSQGPAVFNGKPVTPAGQVTGTIALSAPLFAPVLWAQTVQAQDLVQVQRVNVADVRRQIAVATAQAYLSIIARRRVFEADVRARDVARAHYDLAHQQLAAGAGSLLNQLRAQQSLSADEVLVEEASLDVYRAQEALGVLIGADSPVDTSDEPVLQVPMTLQAAEAAMPDMRSDVRLAAARQAAASRVWKDSWKDWLPTVSGLVQPQYLQPSTVFSPSASWRAQVAASLPLFDAGLRRALRTEREASFTDSQLEHEAVLRQAKSDVRTSRESVQSAERSLAAARAAAEQARHVLDIVNVSFKAGAATEIEVIDAQRALLDAETSVAATEDLLRQARLALLVALGQFPS